MTKRLHIDAMIILGLVLCLSVAGCSKKEGKTERQAPSQSKAPATQKEAQHTSATPRTAFEKAADASAPGAETFRMECAMCHRGFSTGVLMLERRLGKEYAILEERKDLNPDYIRAVVRNGLINMPAFSKVELTDEELDEIAAYLARNNKARE